MSSTLFEVLMCGIVVVVGYALGQRFLPKGARVIAVRLHAMHRRSLRELDGIVRALLWTAVLVLLCILTLLLLRIRPNELLMPQLDLRLLAGGILLGLGEAGFASLLCYVAVNPPWTRAERREAGVPRVGDENASADLLGRLNTLPFPVTIVMALVVAACEEIMLRAAVLEATRNISSYLALTLCIVLSLVVQAFPGTHSRRTIFPFIGTLVSAPVHGILLLSVPDVRPIIVAQFTVSIFNAL